MSCENLRQVTGQQLLFIGTASRYWTQTQHIACAKWASSLGFDCVLLKVADGTTNWYIGGSKGYDPVRKLYLDNGMGCIAYTYGYGNHYGNNLDREADILLDYLNREHIVCLDMEGEWNNQVSWSAQLAKRLQGHNGTFLISTWADPQLQGYILNIKNLAPVTAAWMPQIYSDNLDQMVDVYATLGVQCIQPTVMVDPTNWAGPNNPVNIARRAHSNKHTAISIWHYATCTQNVPLTRAILAAFPKIMNTPPIVHPTPLPVKGVTMSPNIQKALEDEWISTDHIFPNSVGPAFDELNPIVQKWIDAALFGCRLGPPLDDEYDTHDWNGQPIKAMQFSSGRIELDAKNNARVFTAHGEVMVPKHS